ncbi:putative amidophosphoribosyltransferase [Paenibacillus qinlingensis]|uniref:Amidophosphoribosyltransferase n=1 Tax=Paenibacillus qinlingensis TaxID=1837343 RepID=A0ABU1NUI9_9BACL|nr:putative amidophosphoribosyltransferase [Paenibacillus qinlingensis]
MITCKSCSKPTELQMQRCSHCGAMLSYTVAEKFDLMAEMVEQALKQELEARRRLKH